MAVTAARRAFDTGRWSADVEFGHPCLMQLHEALDRARLLFRVARRLRTGNVTVNGRSHFGGTRQSGLGRRNGDEGFREYLEITTIGQPG